jgi:hypothetical protein
MGSRNWLQKKTPSLKAGSAGLLGSFGASFGSSYGIELFHYINLGAYFDSTYDQGFGLITKYWSINFAGPKITWVVAD